jgi:hypothetical protein
LSVHTPRLGSEDAGCKNPHLVNACVCRMLLSWVVLHGAGVRASHVVVVGGVAWCGGACVACCCRGWCCMVRGCVRCCADERRWPRSEHLISVLLPNSLAPDLSLSSLFLHHPPRLFPRCPRPQRGPPYLRHRRLHPSWGMRRTCRPRLGRNCR